MAKWTKMVKYNIWGKVSTKSILDTYKKYLEDTKIRYYKKVS